MESWVHLVISRNCLQRRTSSRPEAFLLLTFCRPSQTGQKMSSWSWRADWICCFVVASCCDCCLPCNTAQCAACSFFLDALIPLRQHCSGTLLKNFSPCILKRSKSVETVYWVPEPFSCSFFALLVQVIKQGQVNASSEVRGCEDSIEWKVCVHPVQCLALLSIWMLLCNLDSTDWSPVPQWKHCRVNVLEQHVCRTVSLHDSNCCLRTHTRPSLSCHHCRSLACKRLRLSENTSSVTVPWMFSFSHFSDMIMTQLSAQSPIQSMLLTTARICKKSMRESHQYCQSQSDTQTLFFFFFF